MPKSEQQLPHGIIHKRRPSGKRVKVVGLGRVAVCDPTFVSAMREIIELHAAGASYQAIGRKLAELEADDRLKRRGQWAERSYQQVAADGDPQGLYDMAKSFFVVNNRPADNPALYLAKVRAWRTGTLVWQRKNDVVGRSTTIGGRSPEFGGEDDFYGNWPIETEVGFPVVDGQPLEGWGIDQQTWEKVEARLLREVREPAKTGGAAHHVSERRVLNAFGTWLTDDQRYPDEATQWTAYPRHGNSRNGRPGRASSILLHRPASHAIRTGDKPRGWSAYSKPEHIAATINLDELTAAVEQTLHRAIMDGLLVPSMAAPVRLVARRDNSELDDQAATLTARIKQAAADAQAKRTAAKALPEAIGLAAAAGQMETVTTLMASIAELNAEAEALDAQHSEIEGQLASVEERRAAPDGDHDQTAELSVLAYLVAGLRHAANRGGRGPVLLGNVADELLTDWRLTPLTVDGDSLVEWRCVARVPLEGSGHAELPLIGWVNDVRTLSGGKLVSGPVLARYLLHDGRSLDATAATLGHTRKNIVVQRLMPWLADKLPQGTHRGLKCAIIDHPHTSVRKLLYLHLTGADTNGPGVRSWSPGWRRHILKTYTNPDGEWGFAACPDDLTLAHQVAATLTAAADASVGVALADLSAASGVSEDAVRELAAPTARVSGFRRPAYFELVPGDPAAIRLRACPHRKSPNCRGFASHVVLLPETAAGHGVVCPSCRLMPVDGLADVQLPSEYLTHVSGTGRGGSLREKDQTRVLDSSPEALDVAAIATVTVTQIAAALDLPRNRAAYVLSEVLSLRTDLHRGVRRYPHSAIDEVRRYVQRDRAA